jgi:hypothetical protein
VIDVQHAARALAVACEQSSKHGVVRAWVVHGSFGAGDVVDVAGPVGTLTTATVRSISTGALGTTRMEGRATSEEDSVVVALELADRSVRLGPGFELRGIPEAAATPRGFAEDERARVGQMLGWCRANGYGPSRSIMAGSTKPTGAPLLMIPLHLHLATCRDETALEVLDAWAAERGAWPQPLDDRAVDRLRTASGRLAMLAFALDQLRMPEESDRYLLRSCWIDERSPMSSGERTAAGVGALVGGLVGGGAAGSLTTGLEAASATRDLRGVDPQQVPKARRDSVVLVRRRLVGEGRAVSHGFCATCGAVVRTDAGWRCERGHEVPDVRVAVPADVPAAIAQLEDDDGLRVAAAPPTMPPRPDTT